MIAQAQSGTGKTATFTISVLQNIDINKRECQALILGPTRELAQQVRLRLNVPHGAAIRRMALLMNFNVVGMRVKETLLYCLWYLASLTFAYSVSFAAFSSICILSAASAA